MRTVIKHVFINDWEQPKRTSKFEWEPSAGASNASRFEVNVLFTNPKDTLAALRAADALARDLNATIRVLAVQAVPFAMPLEQPPVSTAFTEKVLLDLVDQDAQGAVE